MRSCVQITYLPQKNTWKHERNWVGAFDGKKTTFEVELFPLAADLLSRVLSLSPFSLSEGRFNAPVSLETQ